MSKKSIINLDVSRENGSHIHHNDGGAPYLWIGGKSCYGCVPDNEVVTLRDWCNSILRKQRKASK